MPHRTAAEGEGAFRTDSPIILPVDPRIAQVQRPPNTPHESSRHSYSGRDGGHHHHHHHNDQDPKLFGPGFTSAAVHSAVESQVRYVLVTREMLSAIEAGRAPHTELVQPAGTTLRPHTPSRHHQETHDYVPELPRTAASRESEISVSSEKAQVAHLSPSESNKEGLFVADAAPLEPFLPNPIAKLRHKFKEPFGEFIGTMVLIIFGNGVNCQVVLSGLTQGSYLSISFGWGIGVMFGVYACGGVSGAHLNPAVTIALAAFRGFPWRKVPGYAIGQLLGAFVGSCLIQGNYHNLLNQFEGGYNVRTFGEATSTGSLFFTAAQPYMSNIGAFFSEFFATAVLLGLILCLGDANNNPAPPGMNGLILLWLIVGIGAALGTQTAYCLNPARDLGPRIAAAVYGYPSTIWTYRNYYFLYVPILATITGALFGCFVYDLFVFAGPESPLNRKWDFASLKRRLSGGGARNASGHSETDSRTVA